MERPDHLAAVFCVGGYRQTWHRRPPGRQSCRRARCRRMLIMLRPCVAPSAVSAAYIADNSAFCRAGLEKRVVTVALRPAVQRVHAFTTCADGHRVLVLGHDDTDTAFQVAATQPPRLKLPFGPLIATRLSRNE